MKKDEFHNKLGDLVFEGIENLGIEIVTAKLDQIKFLIHYFFIRPAANKAEAELKSDMKEFKEIYKGYA